MAVLLWSFYRTFVSHYFSFTGNLKHGSYKSCVKFGKKFWLSIWWMFVNHFLIRLYVEGINITATKQVVSFCYCNTKRFPGFHQSEQSFGGVSDYKSATFRVRNKASQESFLENCESKLAFFWEIANQRFWWLNIFCALLYLLCPRLYEAYELYISDSKITKTKLLTQSNAKSFFQQWCERRTKPKGHHINTQKKQLKELYTR